MAENNEVKEKVSRNEVNEESIGPWTKYGLTEKTYNRAMSAFQHFHCLNKEREYESDDDRLFSYFLMGRSSVSKWELTRPYIITSGPYNNQILSSNPHPHRRVGKAMKEMERLSKHPRNKGKPFYLWGAESVMVDGKIVLFSPALYAIE